MIMAVNKEGPASARGTLRLVCFVPQALLLKRKEGRGTCALQGWVVLSFENCQMCMLICAFLLKWNFSSFFFIPRNAQKGYWDFNGNFCRTTLYPKCVWPVPAAFPHTLFVLLSSSCRWMLFFLFASQRICGFLRGLTGSVHRVWWGVEAGVQASPALRLLLCS